MRILFIGSYQDGYSTHRELKSLCNSLGKKLAGLKIKIILCSPFPDAIDYYLIQGVKSAKNINSKIDLYYPQDDTIDKKWDNLLGNTFEKNDTVVKRFTYVPIEKKSEKDWRHSWLFCQIQALNNSDIVFVLGGDTNGASSLLLRIAEKENKRIFPIRTFGGSGYLFFERNKYELRDKLGAKYYSFLEGYPKKSDLFKLIRDYPIRLEAEIDRTKDPLFFISYPRARPEEADFIEMILRRRNFTVLRDEEEFKPDVDIPNAIKENIFKSNIFIATWCKEYACSPWCFDELSLALERKRNNNLEIWLICTDETRIIHPEARKMLHHPVSSREEIHGKISNLIKRYKLTN